MSSNEAGHSGVAFGMVMTTLGLTILGLWFFLHPNSPWHERYHYHVAFTELGTLQAGDPVQVNGLPRGEVVGVSLVDSATIVEIKVLANVKLPVDTKFRIVNVGLMGQREVEVRPGISTTLMKEGDTLRGDYDLGSTRLVFVAANLLRSVDSLLGIVGYTLDSTVLNPAAHKQFNRIGKKAVGLQRTVATDVANYGEELGKLTSQLELTHNQAMAEINANREGVMVSLSQIDSIKGSLQSLKQHLSSLDKEAQWVNQKLQSPDNTAGLVVSGTDFRVHGKQLVSHSKSLLSQIGAKGLDLNVDIW